MLRLVRRRASAIDNKGQHDMDDISIPSALVEESYMWLLLNKIDKLEEEAIAS